MRFFDFKGREINADKNGNNCLYFSERESL